MSPKWIAGALMLAAGLPAMAQDKEALYLKSLAATCANCHGTNGRAVEGSSVVSLAGLQKSYLVAQLKAFKSGARPATIMHQLSKGYSDAQIDQIAGYFAAQAK
ncbi:c-type cytochrome [Variovorax terrae]|uniref:C-type cytochrome n=1 Tax=Variovorax terrae TaxID=2923278 RepID=A0A9X1VZG1_9BURK|nr:c-type cytochrome [Variovorax terrae]MCJ0766108.1 c-type cytochrome [Variovorax terrae]